MRKTLLSLALCAASAPLMLGANPGSFYLMPEGIGCGVSSNGRYIWGYDNFNEYRSFVFDMNTGDYDWVTGNTESNEDGGRIRWINSNGTMVGDMLDDDMIMAETDPNYDGEVIENVPLHTAFVLKKDGTRIKLDHASAESKGDWETSHENPNYYYSYTDGAYALRITDDESVVFGYLSFATYVYPCYWEYNPETKTYDPGILYHAGLSPYCENFYIVPALTDDGMKMAFATTSSGFQIYEYGTRDPYTLEIEGINDIDALVMSPDGRYYGLSWVGEEGWSLGIYDCETEELTPIILNPGQRKQMLPRAISNDGVMSLTFYETSLVHHHYIADLRSQSMVSFPKYLESFPDGMEYLDTNEFYPLESAMLSNFPSNGRIMVGTFISRLVRQGSFIVELPENPAILVRIPAGLNAFYSSADKAKVRWEPITAPNGSKLVGYDVYLDGKLLGRATTDKAADGMCEYEFALQADGRDHVAEVMAVVSDQNNKEYFSDKTGVKFSMTANTSLYFFDNLDDVSIIDMHGNVYYEGDVWKVVDSEDNASLYPSTIEYWNGSAHWQFVTAGVYSNPVDGILESRFFDATNEKDFYLTYELNMRGILQFAETTAGACMAVEWSEDGENWKPLNVHYYTSTPLGAWNRYVVDMKELEGKVFKLRFRAHADYLDGAVWYLDYTQIAKKADMYENAPRLMEVSADKKEGVKLSITDSTGDFELSYGHECPSTAWDQYAGSMGEPLIVAVEFRPEMLKPYVGMYMRNITAPLYDTSSVPMTAEGIIYEQDGKEWKKIGTGTFKKDEGLYFTQDKIAEVNYAAWSCVYLDEPIKIEEGKAYRVAVRISDYEAESLPIYYCSQTEDYIPGITDLFSEDEGKTWISYCDLYAGRPEEIVEAYGRVIFPIRLGINPDKNAPREKYDPALWCYNVYRDGEKINEGMVYFTQPHFVDEKPLAEGATAEYTVEAFYRDGHMTVMSEPLAVTMQSGVADVAAARVKVVAAHGELRIYGDFQGVEIYNTAGQRLLSTRAGVIGVGNYAPGVYLVRVATQGTVETHKVIIK